MSCASYRGTGHRVEFFGEDGTLVLHNPGADYMRGFELLVTANEGVSVRTRPVDDPADAKYPDGRIAPVSRLVKDFLDAIGAEAWRHPGLRKVIAYNMLIDAARRSHLRAPG